MNVKRGILDWSGGEAKRWPDADPGVAEYALRLGDIVIAMDGLVGRSNARITEADLPAYLVQRVARLRAEAMTDQSFLYHLVASASFARHCWSRKTGTTISHISKADIEEFEIPRFGLPAEQRLGRLLDLAERAQQLTDALIAAKREQKRGLMQQLLTGKVRFPGFTEPWKTVRLEDVAEVRFSNVDKHTHPGERAIRLCNYTDVFRNRFIQPDMDFMTASASDREIEKFGLQAGDVAITKDSETPDEIGVPALIERASPDLVLGYHLALLRANRAILNPGYLLTLMESDLVRAHFQRRASGLTRFALSTGAVADTPVLLPSLKEQARIANLYRDLTTEEDLLKQQRTTFANQRRGLMECLLSGEIDIPSSDTSAA